MFNVQSLYPAEWYLLETSYSKKDKSSHPYLGFDSDDPAYLNQMLGAAKDEGFAGMIQDHYGFQHQGEDWMYEAGLQIRNVSEKLGMKFGMMVDNDSGANNNTASMLAILGDLSSKFFPSPAYMREDDGRFTVLEFDCAAVDWNAVSTKFPRVKVLHRGAGPGKYGWWNYPGGQAQLTGDNMTAEMPCVIGGVDDTSPWGKGRTIDYRDGQTCLDVCAAIPRGRKRIIVATNTDNQEGTDWAGNILKASGRSTYGLKIRPMSKVFFPPATQSPTPVPITTPGPTQADFDAMKQRVAILESAIAILQSAMISLQKWAANTAVQAYSGRIIPNV
jgi:hypothetical protein